MLGGGFFFVTYLGLDALAVGAWFALGDVVRCVSNTPLFTYLYPVYFFSSLLCMLIFYWQGGIHGVCCALSHFKCSTFTW